MRKRLVGPMVTMRQHQPSDVAGVLDLARDPETIRWTSVPDPYQEADAQDFFALGRSGWASESHWLWAIESVDAEVGKYAGNIMLRRIDFRSAELGYALAPWARGRGLMSEAVDLALDWAFQDCQLSTITWRAQVGNWPSRRLAQRCGFTLAEEVTASCTQRGRTYPAWSGVLRRSS